MIKKHVNNGKSIMKAPVIENAAEIEFILKGEEERAAADAIKAYFEANN